jgi:hypothetical protein
LVVDVTVVRAIRVCVSALAAFRVGEAVTAMVAVAEGATVATGVIVAGGTSEGSGGSVGIGADGKSGAGPHATNKTPSPIARAITNLFISLLPKKWTPFDV